MKKLLMAMFAFTLLVPAMHITPALAWDAAYCNSGAAGKEPTQSANGIAGGQEAIAWCQYNYPKSPVALSAPPINNTNTNNNNQHQGQHQSQNQALNNRLSQSLSNSGNSYTNVREVGQLPMVNAPECGGANAGISADLQGSLALSVAVHFGRRSDSCVHHDEVPPTTNVHVDVAAAAPIVQPAPIVTHEVRTVYVKQVAAPRCRNYPASDLAYWFNDLKRAKHTRDVARIHTDRAALESACRGDLVDRAIDP